MGLVEVKNVTKNIKKSIVLQNISLSLSEGTIYGFKGKNGSGKTMLMRVISGLISPTEGEVYIDEQLLGKDISFPPSLGIMIENPSFLPNYSGFDNLKLIASLKNICTDEDIKEAIRKVGLDPEDKKKYKKYSLGMKQRLGIACAIMEKPKIIILDEPTNALDENGVLELRNILYELKENGSLIIISCHDTEELVLLSDKIINIQNGRIVSEN